MNPTARSKQLLEKQGYIVTRVEQKVRFPNRENPLRPITMNKDAFGFGDLLYCGNGEIGLCQSTSRSNIAARVGKILDLTETRVWLQAGGKIIVHGWAKQGARGGRKTWQANEKTISLDTSVGQEHAYDLPLIAPEAPEQPQATPEPANRQRRSRAKPNSNPGLFTGL